MIPARRVGRVQNESISESITNGKDHQTSSTACSSSSYGGAKARSRIAHG
jgi:hypothetical protein